MAEATVPADTSVRKPETEQSRNGGTFNKMGKVIEEKRIYVVVAATVQVPTQLTVRKSPLRTVVQPVGRQAAQIAHAVSKLRHRMLELQTELSSLNTLELFSVAKQRDEFIPITTIVLQARDSAEMGHVHYLSVKRRLNPVLFSDDNPEYGPGSWPTAFALLATKKQVDNILGYLPLWGS